MKQRAQRSQALSKAHITMWALLFVLLLSSCSSIGTHIPAMQMESPETHGKLLRARLSFAGASTSDIIVIDDASSRPLRYNNPTKNIRDSEFYVSGSLGVLDRLDVGIKAGVVRSPTVLFGKYQFFGPNNREAKQGDRSLALLAGVGTHLNSKSGNQDGLFGRGGYKWSAEQRTHSREIQLIVGQRTTDQTLVYLGPYYADYKMAGSVKHELSDDNLSPAVDYRFEGQGTRTGLNANVEVQLGKLSSSHFTFAAGYSKLTWTNAEDLNAFDLGIALNFNL